MGSTLNGASPINEGGRRRLVRWLSALVCLFFVASLSDVSPRWASLAAPLAPSLPPAAPGDPARDAALVVAISGADQAIVRVFSIVGDQAYLAGERRTDEAKEARFDKLPHGETWVLAYGEGKARGSSRVLLDAGERRLELALVPAHALDVLVVDGDERAVEGAMVTVRTADPVPYLLATSGDGHALFDRLGPPPFVVSVIAEGFDPAVRSGVFPGRAPLRVKLDRLAALEVVVIDTDGEPAPGATVLAAGPGLWPARSTLTGDDGKALLRGLRAGAYDLKAELGGLVSRTELGFTVRAGQTEQVELSLEPGRMIDVLVTDGDVDADGREPPPIEGASVVVVEEGLSSFPLQARTARDGHAVLGPVADGPATASARAPGFVPTAAVVVEPDTSSVRVPLRRGGVLVGRVEDDRGYPIDGATLEVIGVDDRGMPIDETSGMTEFREHHFEFAMRGPLPLLPVGELGVMPGPIPDLPRGGLFVVPEVRAGSEPWITGFDGQFRAEPVSPGRLQVIARHPSYVDGISETFALKPGETKELTIVLSEGGRLEGRVVEEDGLPVGGARVELAALEGGIDRTTYAADDGTFAFAAAPRRLALRVARPEAPFDIAARVSVEVPPRERRTVEIVLPKRRGSSLIRVVDDRGYAITSAEVRVASLDFRTALHKTDFTGDEGQVEIDGVRGLPVRIVIDHPLYAPLTAQVDPVPDTMRFTMLAGLTVKGTVTAREGRDRIEGAVVSLHTTSGTIRLQTGADGDFESPNVPTGRLRVVAHKEGLSAVEKLVVAKGDDRHAFDLGELDLGIVGVVEGVVLDLTGEPVAGARVAVGAVPTYLPLGPLPPGVVTTDRDGRFVLEGVREGQTTLEAFFGDLGRGWAEGVEVRGGRTTRDVEIRLEGDRARAASPPTQGSVALTLGEATVGGVNRVVVYLVPPGGEAEVAGIEPGDLLLAADGQAVTSIERARQLLTGSLSEDVVVRLARDMLDGTTQVLRLRVRRERVRR